MEKVVEVEGCSKVFHRKEVGNGRHTSFWYDKWSEKGVLIDPLGEKAIKDMGTRK